jgi:DnaJ family protein C protein 17
MCICSLLYVCPVFFQAAYDRVLNAKKAAKVRHRELDSKRQKLKEELEARERQAEEAAKQYRSFMSKTDEERLQVTDEFPHAPAC